MPVLAVIIDFAKEAQTQGLSYAASDEGIGVYVQTILSGVLAISALAVFIFLIWGAFEWIIAGGEKGKIETARNKITGALMGFVVLTAVIVIFKIVQSLFNIELITFI